MTTPTTKALQRVIQSMDPTPENKQLQLEALTEVAKFRKSVSIIRERTGNTPEVAALHAWLTDVVVTLAVAGTDPLT